MPIQQTYKTGTITVVSGSAVVTGFGTAWVLGLVNGGQLSFNGFSVPIVSVESNTSLTLDYPAPAAMAGSGAYSIVLGRADAASAIVANRQLAELTDLLRSKVSPFAATLLDDANAAEMLATIGAAAISHPLFLSGYTGNLASIASDYDAGGLGIMSTDGGAALMKFHVPTAGLVYFGLDTDLEFKVGGFSYGAQAFKLWSQRNFDPATKLDKSGGEIANSLVVKKRVTIGEASEATLIFDNVGKIPAAIHVNNGLLYIGKASFTTWPMIINLDTGAIATQQFGDMKDYIDSKLPAGGKAVNSSALNGIVNSETVVAYTLVQRDANGDIAARKATLEGTGDLKTYIDKRRKQLQVVDLAGTSAAQVIVAIPAGIQSIRISGVARPIGNNVGTQVQFSFDGGATYPAGGGTYAWSYTILGGGNAPAGSNVLGSFGSIPLTDIHSGIFVNPRAEMQVDATVNGSITFSSKYTRFEANAMSLVLIEGAGPIGIPTHMRITTTDGSDMGARTRLLIEGY